MLNANEISSNSKPTRLYFKDMFHLTHYGRKLRQRKYIVYLFAKRNKPAQYRVEMNHNMFVGLVCCSNVYPTKTKINAIIKCTLVFKHNPPKMHHNKQLIIFQAVPYKVSQDQTSADIMDKGPQIGISSNSFFKYNNFITMSLPRLQFNHLGPN